MASSGQAVTDQAFVTLATNDMYALGALVLGHSLRHAGTTRQLAIMITSGVTQGLREQLSSVFDNLVTVDVLDSRDNVNLALLTRPDLGITFTKFHCWRLTQYSKCVFLDADTLVMQNVDELFDREELSAAPDAGWPDCFNSGVFVYCPSEERYQSLLQFAVTQGSFDGGDQGLLNMYFSDWPTKDIARHLPFIYNVVSQAFYSYLPAFRHYGKNIRIVHFIGAQKPWHHTYNIATRQVEPSGDTGHNYDFLQLWWDIFMQYVQPHLDPQLSPECGLQELFLSSVRHCPDEGPERRLDEFCMTSPYIPPTIDIFYEQPASCEASKDAYVLNQEARPFFMFHEAFYCEPPMTQAAEYSSGAHMYEAKEFDSHWSTFGKDSQEIDSQNDCDNNNHCVVDMATENSAKPECEPHDHSSGGTIETHSNSSGGNLETHSNSPGGNIETQSNRSGGCCEKEPSTTSGGGDSENQENYENVEELIHCESHEDTRDLKTACEEAFQNCANVKSDYALIGLVGEMSSLHIEHAGHYTPEQLADRDRQFAWERGQIDYLGIDSFQLIQQRIDQVLSSPKTEAEAKAAKAAQAPAPAPKPKTRTPPTAAAAPAPKVAAKPTQVKPKSILTKK